MSFGRKDMDSLDRLSFDQLKESFDSSQGRTYGDRPHLGPKKAPDFVDFFL